MSIAESFGNFLISNDSSCSLRLSKKGSEYDWYYPSEFQTNYFEYLKDSLDKTPILSFPKRFGPSIIDTDLSSYFIGDILMQHQDDGSSNTWSKLGFLSKTLTDT